MGIVSFLKPKFSSRVGLILLLIPAYFIAASVLRQNAPGLSLMGSPIILLGALFAALALNVLSILSVNLSSERPPVLNVTVALRFWNLAVIVTGLLLLAVLLSYAFVENFQARSGS